MQFTGVRQLNRWRSVLFEVIWAMCRRTVHLTAIRGDQGHVFGVQSI